MILDCCGQQRTYEKFYGLLAQRLCAVDRKYVTPFQAIFAEQYATVHRLETNKLRNVGKFFSHLLHTDAISWQVGVYVVTVHVPAVTCRQALVIIECLWIVCTGL